MFDPTDQMRVRLVFVAGPNGDCDQGPRSATRATLSAAAVRDVEFLKAGAKQAMRAGLDAMIAERAQVAVLAWISTGIYAPEALRADMQAAIPTLVAELLREGVGLASIPRSHFFEQVVLPDIAPPAPADLKHPGDTAPSSTPRTGGVKPVSRRLATKTNVGGGRGRGVIKTVSKQQPFKSIQSLLRASSGTAKKAPAP